MLIRLSYMCHSKRGTEANFILLWIYIILEQLDPDWASFEKLCEQICRLVVGHGMIEQEGHVFLFNLVALMPLMP